MKKKTPKDPLYWERDGKKVKYMTRVYCPRYANGITIWTGKLTPENIKIILKNYAKLDKKIEEVSSKLWKEISKLHKTESKMAGYAGRTYSSSIDSGQLTFFMSWDKGTTDNLKIGEAIYKYDSRRQTLYNRRHKYSVFYGWLINKHLWDRLIKLDRDNWTSYIFPLKIQGETKYFRYRQQKYDSHFIEVTLHPESTLI
jgi:hypothetical protein